MDLIATLASQLGVDPQQAQAVAGTVLGSVQSQVAENVGAEQASALGAAMPELGGWQAAATAMMGAAAPAAAPSMGGGLLGSFASAAGGGLGNSLLGAVAGEGVAQQAQLVGLLSQLGIGADKAALVAPTVMSFVKERVPADLLDQVLKAAPGLLAAMGQGEAPAAGVGGMISGFFGS
jgi:hypothetical protein